MIRIFFDEDSQALIVQGSKTVYPGRSLRAELNGSQIEVWINGEERRIVGPVAFTAILDEAGSGFSSLTLAKAYLDGEFAKGGGPHLELSSANW